MPTSGLRARKKARAITAIQQAAFQLFREKGFERTTVEQIADAADISSRTFFRYFRTKEAVVMEDVFDPAILKALQSQPPGMSPIQALRAALRVAHVEFSGEQRAVARERQSLIFSTPVLRTRLFDEFTRTVQLCASAVADRVGRPANDLAVLTFAGAVIGVAFATLLTAAGDPTADHAALLDDALQYLEAGLPL